MKLRPIFKCHGGKWYIHQWIISNFPTNYTQLRYYDGCGGAGSVLLNKEPSIYEVFNDADPTISAIVQELALPKPKFIDDVKKIEYTAESFELAKNTEISPITELVLRRMSRGGLKKAFSWSNRLRGGKPGDVNAWNTFKDQLELISERLQKVNVYSMPVVDLISQYDDYDVLWYLDPPYLPSTRQSQNIYTVEMTEEEHVNLAYVLNNAKGKVCLSGYQSQLYAKLYKDWNMACLPIANHSSQSSIKQKRIEVLWINY